MQKIAKVTKIYENTTKAGKLFWNFYLDGLDKSISTFDSAIKGTEGKVLSVEYKENGNFLNAVSFGTSEAKTTTSDYTEEVVEDLPKPKVNVGIRVGQAINIAWEIYNSRADKTTMVNYEQVVSIAKKVFATNKQIEEEILKENI